MELEDDSSNLRSSAWSQRSSRLSTAGSEASDKRRSHRGRRSSMSVKEVVNGIEVIKDVIIGEDMAKVNARNSSLVPEKIAAIDEEKEHLTKYIKKLESEKEQWDKLLQNYEKSADIAESEIHKPIVLSSKHVEEVRMEYMGSRDTPSSIEIALAMKPALHKKTELQILENQKLKDGVAAAEERSRRLQELIKIQRKYLDFENKDELLAKKAECDATLQKIENWMIKHGFSAHLDAI
ncbi:unnamed protein product [Litomosoides sigmodontis]|uniref:Uncharacterized protein n=1 Tax=Litomosoides sigmodontis TaxID=42156 RepID=A0A3P6UL37_LITSI|nr:unnamed protein product [Litomosoides sigmodontis]